MGTSVELDGCRDVTSGGGVGGGQGGGVGADVAHLAVGIAAPRFVAFPPPYGRVILELLTLMTGDGPGSAQPGGSGLQLEY